MTIIQASAYGKTSFQKLLGYNNRVMTNWSKLGESLEETHFLNRELKEEIRRMLAQKNGCLYCKAKGKPSNNLNDSKSVVCIGFTEVYMKLGTNIPNYAIKILKEELSDEEISELISFITFTTCQQSFGAIMQLQP